MSSEVHDWLTALLAEDPQVGRLVGEAMTILFTDGVGTPLDRVLSAECPLNELDLRYQRMLDLMQSARRSVTDLASERKRAELRLGQDPGRDDLRRRCQELEIEVQEATLAVQGLQARIDAYRSRKEVAKAGYTAALATRDVNEALAAMGESTAPGADGLSAAQAAVERLLRAATDVENSLRDGPPALPIFELRLGTADLRLLFAVEDPDTAVPLVVGIDRDDWVGWYTEALKLADQELTLPSDDFTGYDGASSSPRTFPARRRPYGQPRPGCSTSIENEAG
jgi:phage shock protein A